MARLTMKQMQWIGVPRSWRKDWRSVRFETEAGTRFPDNCPLLCAAWDGDIQATSRITLPPKGGECGLILFQTPRTFAALGLAPDQVRIRTRILDYGTESTIPVSLSGQTATLGFQRRGSRFALSYAPEGQPLRQLLAGTLPDLATSYSIGWYAANPTESPFTVTVDSFVTEQLPTD